MHIVLFVKAVRLNTIKRFPESIDKMYGRVEVPALPRPVKVREPLPFVPGIATSRLSKEAAFEPIIIGVLGTLLVRGIGI
jgi:hypothetical protein